MKQLLFTTILLIGANAFADPQSVAGRTFVCGRKAITFDSTGYQATVGKRSYPVGWGNRFFDARVGDYYLVFSSQDDFELDDVPCKSK